MAFAFRPAQDLRDKLLLFPQPALGREALFAPSFAKSFPTFSTLRMEA
jgi:hypothetical protein